jgi:hypothetical protein
LTVRVGPKVDRRSYDSLDAAVEALRAETLTVQREGGLPEISAFRTYSPDQRVAARLEISTGGFLRGGADAGLDVMGDGSVVPFRGGVFRRPLEGAEGDDAFAAIEAELRS